MKALVDEMARTRIHEISLGLLGKWSVAACGIALCAALAGCGGSKSSSTTPTSTTLAASPATFNAFGNTVNVIGITGGVGPFKVTSSDPATVAVTSPVVGATFTITPKNVLTNTVVNLTVTDSAGATSAVAVTVVPATIPAGLIVVTPATGSVCAPENNAGVTVATLCQGEAATASVTLKDANGVALANRAVRFEALTIGATLAEKSDATVFARLTTVNTDANGVAKVALKADVEATSEAAFLRATDMVSTHRVDTWITVLKQTDGVSALGAVPTTGGLVGYFTAECTPVVREYGIYGGKAPYSVTLPSGSTLILGAGGVEAAAGNGVTVASAGGRFTVKQVASTSCATSSALITITDATGATNTATFTIATGSNTRPTTVTDLTVSPATLSLVADPVSTYCATSSAQFAVAGGTAPYLASASIPQIATTLTNGNLINASFVSDGKWKMLKGQSASLLVLDGAGKVATALLSCN